MEALPLGYCNSCDVRIIYVCGEESVSFSHERFPFFVWFMMRRYSPCVIALRARGIAWVENMYVGVEELLRILFRVRECF